MHYYRFCGHCIVIQRVKSATMMHLYAVSNDTTLMCPKLQYYQNAVLLLVVIIIIVYMRFMKYSRQLPIVSRLIHYTAFRHPTSGTTMIWLFEWRWTGQTKEACSKPFFKLQLADSTGFDVSNVNHPYNLCDLRSRYIVLLFVTSCMMSKIWHCLQST